MIAHGMSGVLMSLLGHLGWDYGRISGGVGGCFIIILDLSWEMTLTLDFGMTCDVGTRPLRKLF
jgi:hypothetical protein